VRAYSFTRSDRPPEKTADRLIVFIRLPEKGRVKTRLARKIGDEDALALYRACVSDILAAACKAGYPPHVFFYPPGARAAVAAWLGDAAAYCLPQEGADLGQRMLAAFRSAFSGCARAILIGSDCPDLTPALLREAFDGLASHDAVLGPSADGGYYLIGFCAQALTGAPFEGIEWGGPAVFDATMAALKKDGLSVHVLPTLRDIDVYEDLEAFWDRNKTLPPGALSTVDFLRGRLGRP
jgi:hypothetical protein